MGTIRLTSSAIPALTQKRQWFVLLCGDFKVLREQKCFPAFFMPENIVEFT